MLNFMAFQNNSLKNVYRRQSDLSAFVNRNGGIRFMERVGSCVHIYTHSQGAVLTGILSQKAADSLAAKLGATEKYTKVTEVRWFPQ